MQKVKFISSTNYEFRAGCPDLDQFTEAVNQFISEHNVTDVQYQSGVSSYVIDAMRSGSAFLHSVMITYDD